MFNVGGGEMFAILLLALLVLGPERLPRAMGEVGKWVGQLRRMSAGFQDELKKAMDAADPRNDDGDRPFAPGEESLPALAPGIEEEVRVVHGPGAADVTPVDADLGADDQAVAAVEPPEVDDTDEAEGGDASVTPLRPVRDDETRATG
jgi:sec-independent protein translocase protein TatB